MSTPLRATSRAAPRVQCAASLAPQRRRTLHERRHGRAQQERLDTDEGRAFGWAGSPGRLAQCAPGAPGRRASENPDSDAALETARPG